MTTNTDTRTAAIIDPVAQVDPSAIIGDGVIVRGNVMIGPGVRIGTNCVLEGSERRRTEIAADAALEDFIKVYPGVRLGEGSRVGAFSILGHPAKEALSGDDNALRVDRVRPFLVEEPVTRIGSGALIRSHGIIYSNVEIAEKFTTGHFIMVREHTRIGSRCVFGTHASVDGYTRIGDRTHVGQYAQLSQSARIGRGVFIGGQTTFSDNIKAVWDVEQDLFGAAIEDYVRIGLNCTILPSVVIGRSAFIGAGSVVSRDVAGGTLAYGSPAKVSRQLTADEIEEYIESVER